MEQSGSCNDLQNTFAINENEHKNEINEYKRDFHLFQCSIILPYILSHQQKSHKNTLTDIHAKTQTLSFCVCFISPNKNFILAYHVKYIMGKCIPKVL